MKSFMFKPGSIGFLNSMWISPGNLKKLSLGHTSPVFNLTGMQATFAFS